MGIYDRDYYREETRSGMEWSGPRTVLSRLVILNVGLFVADIFFGRDHWLMYVLSASPDSLVKPWLWWQLITYGFAHDPTPGHIGHILWNMVGLWIFGRDVEDLYGGREFLRFYLVSIFLGGLIWTLRSFLLPLETHAGQLPILLGASGAVTAVTLLFCIHFPHRTILLMFVLPVPAWAFGLMIIAGNLFGLTSNEAVAFDVHLVGAAFAICYYRFGWRLGNWIPSVSLPTQWLKRRPKLRVHRPEPADVSSDDEADQILDKVNRTGIQSLTRREREILEDYSRRMREKRR